MVFYENGKKFVKEESYAWNEKEIYASDHLIGKNSFQEIKELNGADIDVNKEIKYVNIVNNLALVVFEKDNLNNGKIQFLLYSVDGRFLYGYQITPKNAARIQVGILAESEEICIFDPKFGYDYNDGKIRYGVTIWTAITEVDTKKKPGRRITRHYAALLRISNGVRPYFISIRS